MDRKKDSGKRKKLALMAGCIGLLLGGFYIQGSAGQLSEDGSIQRAPVGGGDKTVKLYLEGEGIPEDYLYELTVEATGITPEKAEELFQKAREEIDSSLYAKGDSEEGVRSSLNLQSSYVEGIVEAEWLFDDYTFITPEGVIKEEALTEEQMVLAQVDLLCGDFRSVYEFGILLVPREKSKEEQLLCQIREALQLQYETGSEQLYLPKEVDGVALAWTEKKEPYVWRILLLEIAVAGLLYLAEGERRREAERRRRELITAEYPEMVGRLAVLMDAGSSLKEAFRIVAYRYRDEREAAKAAGGERRGFKEKPLYEEMLRTYREMTDGESEGVAYRKFGERCGCACCLRLTRLFVQNLQKGNAKLSDVLQAEADNAFEERKLQARKAGEEAGTKLLFPLILMMVIVMAIVIVPAILTFQM